MAVAFFFVLGGFGLTLGYIDRVTTTAFSYKHYLTKRFVKFYPLHWICLLAALPLSFLSFNLKQLPVLAINAALLQTWIPLRGVYFSFNAVSWYLADTMFFAMVFPFLLKWIVRASSKGKVWIALGFAVGYAIVAFLTPANIHHAILYISPYMRLTDFVLGIYLALAFLKLKEKPLLFLRGSELVQIMTVTFIAILVIESCVLSEDAVLYAPVYWPFIALLILGVSLSEVTWGGAENTSIRVSTATW